MRVQPVELRMPATHSLPLADWIRLRLWQANRQGQTDSPEAVVQRRRPETQRVQAALRLARFAPPA